MRRKHDPDGAISSILGRFRNKEAERAHRSRAVLVLEPELAPLTPALKDANFIIVLAHDQGVLEDRGLLLSQRVLVTQPAAAFIDDAPVLEMGIIGLDALAGDIYIGPALPQSKTAVMISKAFLDFDLGNEHGGFLLLLHPAGRHVFRRLS